MIARSAHDGEAVLGSAAEAEWQRLRRQIELASGFWLGFIFCSSPRPVAAMRQRVERLSRIRVSRLRLIRPTSPEELRALLPRLFEEESVQAGWVWVETIHLDRPVSTDDAPGPWAAAWDWMLMRANEHRDAMRRRLKGGVVFAASPQWKPRVRNAAPDLWSVRSLVLDVPASGGDSIHARRRDAVEVEVEPVVVKVEVESIVHEDLPDTAIDVDFALSEARRIEARPEYGARLSARARLRAIEGPLARGRSREAVETADQVLNTLRGGSDSDRLLAEALGWAGQAKWEEGDVATADAHLDEAVRLWKHILDRDGKSPQTLRALSVSLDRLGDMHRKSGDMAGATAAFEESLALCRRLVEAVGETPQAVRDLFLSLDRLGEVHRESGDMAGATAAFEESLALCRRLVEAVGETPQAVRDLFLSLDRLGYMRRESGDMAGATAAFEESLALCRRLVETVGETPQVVRDLSVSLNRLGEVHRESGDMAGATAAFEESLALRRRLVETVGETPQAVRDPPTRSG